MLGVACKDSFSSFFIYLPILMTSLLLSGAKLCMNGVIRQLRYYKWKKNIFQKLVLLK